MENLIHAFFQHFIAQLKQRISRGVWKDNCVYISARPTHGCPPSSIIFFMDTKNVSIVDHSNQTCLLCFSSILSQEVRTIPVPQDKLNWTVQSYLTLCIPLCYITHKHMFTANTTLLI